MSSHESKARFKSLPSNERIPVALILRQQERMKVAADGQLGIRHAPCGMSHFFRVRPAWPGGTVSNCTTKSSRLITGYTASNLGRSRTTQSDQAVTLGTNNIRRNGYTVASLRPENEIFVPCSGSPGRSPNPLRQAATSDQHAQCPNRDSRWISDSHDGFMSVTLPAIETWNDGVPPSLWQGKENSYYLFRCRFEIDKKFVGQGV
jgi:hypothetical protein